MDDRVICNPPIGIYKNKKTHVGHAFYLSLLDAYARYRDRFEGENITFPGKSYNIFGKRGEKLKESSDKINSESGLKEYAERIVEEDEVRGMLNLSSDEILLDDDPEVIEGVKKDFMELDDRGYLKERQEQYFLDSEEIGERNDLQEKIEEIDFYPNRGKRQFERFLEENLEDIRVTRSREYSVDNPLGGESIGPLFTLANLWDSKYPEAEKYTFACSENVLCKYGFLRFLSKTALDDDPGMDEMVVWPELKPEEGIENWELENMIEDPYHGDMLRYTLLKKYTSNDNMEIEIDKNVFKEGRKFVYKIANLRNPFSEYGDRDQGLECDDLKPKYRERMDNFQFRETLIDLKNGFTEISKKVNAVNSETEMKNLRDRYLSLVEMAEPFVPETSQLVKSELK